MPTYVALPTYKHSLCFTIRGYRRFRRKSKMFFFLTKLQRTTRHIESFPLRAVQLVSFLYLYSSMLFPLNSIVFLLNQTAAHNQTHRILSITSGAIGEFSVSNTAADKMIVRCTKIEPTNYSTDSYALSYEVSI